MALTIYNTLTRSKEIFKPITPEHVLFYACGVTVYDYCHLGHARAYVVFDLVRRYLEASGHTVRYVQNFTDIDDKIIKRSQENNEVFSDLTARFIQAYKEDMASLHIKVPTQYTHATEYISEMIEMISSLIEKGHAYDVDGEVCFSVSTFSDYGKLSKKVLDELESGIRVDVSSTKKDPLDFVLWKPSKAGEPSWDSPWGAGRPGWHIECSAMAVKELGASIDIHAGGEDLIFPHHENEIAQSECCTGQSFANYWLHNGFVTIQDNKMSKSEKNFVTIRDILERYSGEVLRFYLLKVHYRRALSFSWDGLSEAQVAWDRLNQSVLRFSDSDQTLASDEISSELQALKDKFFEAMDDDFNSAEAIGVLFELNKFVNTHDGVGVTVLLELGQILGLFNELDSDSDLDSHIQTLVDERQAARANRDFARSDEIRDQLKSEYGILLEDGPDGVRWRKELGS